MFTKLFLQVVFWRPGTALGALGWRIMGKRVRAHNRLIAAAQSAPFAYVAWIDTVESRRDSARTALATAIGAVPLPLLSIVAIADTSTDDKSIAVLISQLRMQSYPNWELVLVAAAVEAPSIEPLDNMRVIHVPLATAMSALMTGIDAASGSFFVPLDRGGILPTEALGRYAQAISRNPDATVLFGDEDSIDRHGTRSKPWFKPQWNSELFLAQDYISRTCAIKTSLDQSQVESARSDDGPPVYALLLRLCAGVGEAEIVHFPEIVWHQRAGAGDMHQAGRVACVADHVRPMGAVARSGAFESVRVDWPLPSELPLVSIILPTRDKFELLRACVESLTALTDYPAIELIIVDNGSVEPETLTYFEYAEREHHARILRYDRPYNYSAINNFAVEEARGSYLCLLNNDTEIVEPDWLRALMRQATRPGVAAAGPKLLYPDGSIQHAGVVIGMGQAAGHAHRNLSNDTAGYFARAHLAHFVSAVTAACLVVEKSKFTAVGGLDERNLAIAFNDVDLCLKFKEAGWQNVYVPQAVLIHHESKSRGDDFAPEHHQRYLAELKVLQKRWGTKTYQDPLHHPDLDLDGENYVIRL